MGETIRKPGFNTALGATTLTQQLKPPFRFQGVTARVFPLKANMSTLRAFCDAYLNLLDPQTLYFKPALPYVYLMVLDYGRMSPALSNLGWVAQNEITFTIPLQRCRKERGRLVFQDWAMTTPFIFVDDEMSLTTGRDVYGWPKIRGWLDLSVNPWTIDPRRPRRLMALSTMVFPEIYAGERQMPRVLIEIEHEPPPMVTEVPPDPQNPLNPILAVPRAILGGVSLMSEALEILAAPRMLGYDPTRNLRSLRAMAGQALRRLRPTRDSLGLEQITLKQFPDISSTGRACYQGIVASRITIDRFNAGGMLGDLDLLRGDPTGGFKIRIHRYAEQPIIDSLGLQVDEESESPEGVSVATLKPTLPFWDDVDLSYSCGHTEAYRTLADRWYGGDEERQDTDLAPNPQRPSYNTARSAAQRAVSGPFRFSDVTLRVLPLMADRSKLEAFCKHYLCHGCYRFEPYGSYVYLVATNFGPMSSETNDIGWWARNALTFYLPIKQFRAQGVDGEAEIESLGLVAPFAYADSGIAVATAREVHGWPMTRASIESPPDAWMAQSGPAAERRLLTLVTEVLPALNLGQRSEQRTLLEIREGLALAPDDTPGWRSVEADWGQSLVRDLRSKTYLQNAHPTEFLDAKALAIEFLAQRAPLNIVALKQFRDADDPDQACYQSLVRYRRTIERLHELGEMQGPLHVRINQIPSIPITSLLGLKPKAREQASEGLVEIFQPIRPFWLRVAIREDLGETLCERTGRRWVDWQTPHHVGALTHRTKRMSVGRGLLLYNRTFGLNSKRLLEGANRWLRAARVSEWNDALEMMEHPATGLIEEALRSDLKAALVDFRQSGESGELSTIVETLTQWGVKPDANVLLELVEAFEPEELVAFVALPFKRELLKKRYRGQPDENPSEETAVDDQGLRGWQRRPLDALKPLDTVSHPAYLRRFKASLEAKDWGELAALAEELGQLGLERAAYKVRRLAQGRRSAELRQCLEERLNHAELTEALDGYRRAEIEQWPDDLNRLIGPWKIPLDPMAVHRLCKLLGASSLAKLLLELRGLTGALENDDHRRLLAALFTQVVTERAEQRDRATANAEHVFAILRLSWMSGELPETDSLTFDKHRALHALMGLDEKAIAKQVMDDLLGELTGGSGSELAKQDKLQYLQSRTFKRLLELLQFRSRSLQVEHTWGVFERLTSEQARWGLERIDEPQAVLERILGEEWMQHVTETDGDEQQQRPEFGIRRDSVGPAESERAEAFARRHGLWRLNKVWWALGP